VQVRYLILACSELFQYSDIFTGTPDSVDRNIKLDLAADEERQLGERELIRGKPSLDWARATLLDGLLDRLRDQGRVLSNMLKRLLGDSLQGSVVVKTEITSVDDVVSSSLFRKIVE
jgi:hypothetical protein